MSEQVFPKVGETVEVVKTLLGGDHPRGWGKIRIWAPAKVHIDGIRTTTTRDPKTNEIISHRMVTLTDLTTNETYPEVKYGALLHAAGLVEEEDFEGRGFFLESQLRSVPEVESEDPFQKQMRELAERMESEFRALIGNPDQVFELQEALCFSGNKIADPGDQITVLGPAGDFFRIRILGRPATFVVGLYDLRDANPLQVEAQLAS